MKSAETLVDARWMGHSFATDPDLLFPERPRLIPELVAVPFASDGLLVAGAKDVQILRGPAARTFLPRLLPELDGRRTLAALAACFPKVRPEALRDAVALLHSRGLVEDGVAPPPPSNLRQLDAFLGRYVDATRANRNRGEALTRLQDAVVLLGGPEHAIAELGRSLTASGVGQTRVAAPEDGIPPEALVVAVVTEDGPDAELLLDRARLAGARSLLARMGADVVEIGPLAVPGESICYSCLQRVHPAPGGALDPLAQRFWLALFAHEIVLLLSRIGDPSLFNALQQFRVSEHGLLNETRYAARMPGCPRCGTGGPPLAPYSPEHLAWTLHTSVALPPRSLLNRREHQAHYRVANVELTRQESEPYHGATLVPLPPPSSLDTPPPWRQPSLPAALSLERLATLLARSAGLNTARAGAQWRIAPTGGNLGSVDLFVLAQAVPGLEPGIYRYHPPRHALERLHDAARPEALRAALGTGGDLPACVIVGCGALGKVHAKYQNFAYRIVYLDAGIALAYLHDLAAALGLRTREFAGFRDSLLAEAVRMHARDGRYAPTFALALESGAAVAPPYTADDISPRVLLRLLDATNAANSGAGYRRRSICMGRSPALASFDDIILERRSIRDYAAAAIPAALIQDLTALAQNICRDRLAAGAPELRLTPWLFVQRGDANLPAGIYQASAETPGLLVPRRAGLSHEELYECMLQTPLADAAAAFFLIGDLGHALSVRGARGYRELLLQSGAAAARLWLGATEYGLGACGSAGFLEAGLRTLTALDGYRDCPLYCVTAGVPATSG